MSAPVDPFAPQPDVDLVISRVVPVPPDRVWRAWTIPAQLMKWFTPAPWKTVEADIDLRPGGQFRNVMQGPEGERNEYVGCYLEIVENRRLVWTMALAPGFRPVAFPDGVPIFTAIITMEPEGSGTRYTATARHLDAAGAQKHEKMGFHEGWGAALDQLVTLVQAM